MCLLLLIMLVCAPATSMADTPMTDSEVFTSALISTVDSLLVTCDNLESPVLVHTEPAGAIASVPMRHIEALLTAHGLALTDSAHTAASTLTLSFSDIRVIVAKRGKRWARTAIMDFHTTAEQPDHSILWIGPTMCRLSDTLNSDELNITDDSRQLSPMAKRTTIGRDSRLPQIVSFTMSTALLVWFAFQ